MGKRLDNTMTFLVAWSVVLLGGFVLAYCSP